MSDRNPGNVLSRHQAIRKLAQAEKRIAELEEAIREGLRQISDAHNNDAHVVARIAYLNAAGAALRGAL